MVTEYYQGFTPVIAHATGGLRRLVKPFADGQGTGFVYTYSPPETQDEVEQWKTIMMATAPEARMKVGIYKDLVANLTASIETALRVVRLAPDCYSQMLGNLPGVLSEFSWDKPSRQYLRWIDEAGYIS